MSAAEAGDVRVRITIRVILALLDDHAQQTDGERTPEDPGEEGKSEEEKVYVAVKKISRSSAQALRTPEQKLPNKPVPAVCLCDKESEFTLRKLIGADW
jgi:hypothetical protein